MGVATFPKDMINKWDRKVTKIMEKKLRCNRFLGYMNWSLPSYMGGFNLFRLQDLQTTNSAAIYLNYAANSLDRFAAWLADPSFYASKTIEDIQLTLAASKLEMACNPAHTTPNYELLPCHYTSGAVEQKLSKANRLITDLIGPSGHLHHYLFLAGIIPNWNLSNHNTLKAAICLPN